MPPRSGSNAPKELPGLASACCPACSRLTGPLSALLGRTRGPAESRLRRRGERLLLRESGELGTASGLFGREA